jgi:hypothetical protein
MNLRTQMRNPWSGKPGVALSIAALFLALSAGCSPVSTPPAEQPAASATPPQAEPATPLPTATSQARLPDGWTTYTSQQCEYAISYPAEIQATDENPYSRTFAFNLANPDEGARNFIYVSVIGPQIQDMVKQGIYQNEVYNYDPLEAEILRNMQVGESKTVRELANVESGFTYQRMPDTQISGYAAQTYENAQPWEFPGGTKEIRYYLSLEGCAYLIGGYLDTTQSNQPDAIHEELFNQIMSTIQLNP